MGFEGKVALITGAGQGIGRAIAGVLSGAGVRVGIADINGDQARQAADELSREGGSALALMVDITQADQVEGMVEKIVKEWGRIDILVNNAGITRDALLLRMKDEDWERVLDVNVTGTFHCTKVVLPIMMKQRSGTIINIASVVGVMGNVGQANYVASKAAVIGFTKSIAREYARRGITANAVAPGFIETAMTRSLSSEVREELLRQIPLSRFGSPLDVAYTVKFLASEEAGYITGQVLHVNGGMWMGS